MKVAVLHCYSAKNAGDGLLVDETLSLIRDAFGSTVKIVMAASHPMTFDNLDVEIVDSGVSWSGYSSKYLRFLRSLDSFDLVVAVGGGYLRGGFLVETVKTVLVHGPQLSAAARTRAPSIYLPQSVGPAGSVGKRLLSTRMRKIDSFYVRDDRSLRDFGIAGVSRSSDLALLQMIKLQRTRSDVFATPVLSIRAVRGKISPLVLDLARQLEVFDGYIQSATGGNDDTDAMTSVGPREILSRPQLMSDEGQPRVVIAVRLHAALMAIRAGHFVIHLAYERKGFGAFNDLGLEQYVHNVNMFEPVRVMRQVKRLIESPEERALYRSTVQSAAERLAPIRQHLLQEMREMGAFSGVGIE
ncbi:hypothetical protein CH306_05790 [Rhodococcus sp. 15-725-2-2b]|uniref:polysaccharide pyruvyl transferase family protein n=1 Tax=unclassified Rhodococcus (in: high G+C Gram-positive bacteria) TaxID=192944 RepID=UPI000B9C1A08|nr:MULTISPECIES: polysaccharide pyruvyl transferase family protein [unclassified Rhodococcus (in: high G+C Gram-positive bacteria)]OZC70063.1 hypothetical protein CH277_07970 [Rhodococcus sp. 06-469-3-2]OZD40424.1 hypothetical protein CH264_26785 [Rhodococcus sp. 06-1477-1A]OZE75221.1 hypothetical protein CH306_05790 [Rhodococcus sp. 15-725-2-2b]